MNSELVQTNKSDLINGKKQHKFELIIPVGAESSIVLIYGKITNRQFCPKRRAVIKL